MFHNPPHFAKTCNILPHATTMYLNFTFWNRLWWKNWCYGTNYIFGGCDVCSSLVCNNI